MEERLRQFTEFIECLEIFNVDEMIYQYPNGKTSTSYQFDGVDHSVELLLNSDGKILKIEVMGSIGKSVYFRSQPKFEKYMLSMPNYLKLYRKGKLRKIQKNSPF